MDKLHGRISRNRYFLFIFFTILLVVFGMLLVSELIIRFADIKNSPTISKRFLKEKSSQYLSYDCYSSNVNGEMVRIPDINEGIWQLVSSTSTNQELPLTRINETPWCIQYRLSKQGMRDRVYGIKAPSGIRRIAIMGDSFVLGVGVPHEKTLPKQIETLLEPEKFQIVNMGKAGTDFNEYVQRLKYIISVMEFKLVIVVFIPNDIFMPERLIKEQDYINDLINVHYEKITDKTKSSWYSSPLQISEVIGSYLQMRDISNKTIKWYLNAYKEMHNPEGLERLAKNMSELANLPSCEVALVIYPLMEGFENEYPFTPIHKKIAQMARKVNIPVLDLAPAFKGVDSKSLQVHPTDHHPNSYAHEIAAKAIILWLKKDLPQFLTQ